jgi:cation transport regulator ChaB
MGRLVNLTDPARWRHQMTDHQKDFLLAEFNTAWDMVLRIDERRGVFARYYTVLFVAVLTIGTNALPGLQSHDLPTYVGLTAIFVFTFVAGIVTELILRSERWANVRYRTKINLIREVFLGSTEHPGIVEYLKHPELGILLHTKHKQPEGLGRTLRSIFWLIRLQEFAIGLCVVGLWLYFYGIK